MRGCHCERKTIATWDMRLASLSVATRMDKREEGGEMVRTPHQVTGDEGKDEGAAEETKDKISIRNSKLWTTAELDAQQPDSETRTYVWLSPFGLRNQAAVERATMMTRPMTKLQL
jgi:hypothetical protein